MVVLTFGSHNVCLRTGIEDRSRREHLIDAYCCYWDSYSVLCSIEDQVYENEKKRERQNISLYRACVETRGRMEKRCQLCQLFRKTATTVFAVFLLFFPLCLARAVFNF